MLKNSKSPHFVVGIGASAGGLRPLKSFFEHLPDNTGASYIVVQHMAPDHKSALAEILERQARIKVVQSFQGQKLEPDHAYVIPPGTYIEVDDQYTINIVAPPEHHRTRMAIDHLFRSMADAFKDKATGIVISGTGSDGAVGLRTIKATEGLTFAQSPYEAEYDSMPRSAIDLGVVDVVTEIANIAKNLKQYLASSLLSSKSAAEDGSDLSFFQSVTDLLAEKEHFELEPYKENTIRRRILRRMSLTGVTKGKDYIAKLTDEAEERQQLLQDLLINVTDFFRDKPAFELLEAEVVDNILTQHQADSAVRVWIAGCATGEEAYSVTILFLEAIARAGKPLELCVFATDIDDEAISIARRGAYPQSAIAELPEGLADKYFDKNETGQFVISALVRSCISFAKHNVFRDPPFSKMSLICCRNLLIYLRKNTQQQVMQAFHFALAQGGYLFLGSSENLGEQRNLFLEVSSKWRIYQRNSTVKRNIMSKPSKPSLHNIDNVRKSGKKSKGRTTTTLDSMRSHLINALPPSVLINGQNQIVYVHGDVSPYIKLTQGEANLDFVSMLVPELRTRIRSGLYSARKNAQRTVVCLPGEFTQSLAKPSNYISVIAPIHTDELDEDSVTVTFEEQPIEPGPNVLRPLSDHHNDQETLIDHLEREVVYLRQELQNTVEELETSTEELKASHEESLSTNEELQSSNEELEASTEELRSLNEELTTVNSQLKDKIEQLSNSHDDTKNFFASTNLATLFLSAELTIKRFTPAAAKLLRIGSQDVDKDINDISRELLGHGMLDEAQQVLSSLGHRECEIETEEGQWYTRRVLPYLTEDRRIDGVVLNFIDITSRKVNLQRIQSSLQQQDVVAKLGMEALRGDDVESLTDQTVREIAHTLKADYCAAFKYHPLENNLLLTAGVGWDSSEVGSTVVANDVAAQTGYTLKSTGVVVVEDFAHEHRFKETPFMAKYRIKSSISCTISHDDKAFGVLSVYSRSANKFRKSDANFIVAAANIISVALQRKQNEALLKESEQRLRIAKDSNNIGAFEYCFDTGELIWDPQLYEYWGLDDNEVITLDTFYAGLHPDDIEPTRILLDRAFEPGGDGHYHTIYRVINRKTKEQNWIEASGQVVSVPDRSRLMVGMVLCVTKQKEMEQTLFNAVSSLEHASDKKNLFLATLGHELRNPIAAINSGIQLLQNDPKESDWALDMMNNNVQLIASLLDGLLDITRISRGQIELHNTAVDLRVLFRDISNSIAGILETKQQRLKLDIPEHPLRSMLDKMRMEQVIFNLLQNASKFSPANSEIVLRLKRLEKHIQIQVEDSGIGISPSKHQQIFEPFEQISPLDSPTSSGLGIGLSIVRTFVELHGGTVDIQSYDDQQGACFTVTLPYVQCPVDVPAANSDTTRNSLRANLRVLIVDDNEDAAKGLETMLKIKGCDVRTASNGTGALTLFKEFVPQVLILDIGLPDMTGYELLKLLRTQGADTTLNIALTGYGHEEARKESKLAGFDYHINKPADFAKLLSVLSNA